MKKRIITSSILLLGSVLLLAGIVLSIFFGRQLQDQERQTFKTVVQSVAGTAGTTAEAQTLSNDRPGYYVLDPAGHEQGNSLPLELKSSAEFQASLGNGEGTSTVTIVGKPVISAAVRLKDGGWLIGLKPLESVALYLNPFNQTILSVMIGLFIVASFAVLYMTGYILEPLAEFTRRTSRIASGDPASRIKLNRNSELDGLAENFNALADRLETTITDSLGSQSQLESILGSMNSGVIAIDNSNKIILFNPFARKIFGIFTGAIGKDIREVIKSVDLDKMLTVSDEFQELILKRKVDTIVRFKTSELLTEQSQVRGKVIVIQDVTDLKKLELMRTEFVSNVSHELKTPLTSIKGFTETLRDVEDPDTKIKFLDIIEAESDRLSRLIEDILSLSVIESQKLQNAILIDAAQATKSCLNLLEVQARNKNIELSLIVKGQPQFVGDADLYRQMIINLIENAIKFTPNNGRVKIRLEEETDWIRLTVADTGIGIPGEHLPRLFERFYRVDKSRDRAQGGTGLGLAIVKHIVITFGGTITVESEPGKGTTFTIMLPALRNKNRLSGTKIESVKFNE